MTTPTLTNRELNRATLARQHLLERVALSPERLLEHLVGLQAQEPQSWYVGFWSRLDPFDPAQVSRLLEERRAVRIALMRSTIHLVTTQDALSLRPLMQPAVGRPLTGKKRRLIVDTIADEVAAAAREALASGPLTNAQLSASLAQQFEPHDPLDLGIAARAWVPLVQVPPRGLWRRSGPAAHTPLETWAAGQPAVAPSSVEDLVRRYLAAYGPASPADARAWSGLPRLTEVFERMCPELLTFRAEDGRELFDVPDAPRPDPETPAPPRFLYDFDNVMLAHHDRTRFSSVELRARMLRDAGMYSFGSLLVDGLLHGTWRFEREGDVTVLRIRLVRPLSTAQQGEVVREAEKLAAFWVPSADWALQFETLEG